MIFKRYFVAGLIVLIPVVATIWILRAIIVYADSMFTGLLPERMQPEVFPGIGLFITIALVLLVGVLAHLYIGRSIMRVGSRVMEKIPLGRSIYNAIKQLMDVFVGPGRKKQYQRVVAVEFPRKGCYMVGFVLGPVPATLQDMHAGESWITVFLPTSPNPTTGFMISMPERETVALPLSIDKAFRYIISGNTGSAFNGEAKK